jgi:hypothetical protein
MIEEFKEPAVNGFTYTLDPQQIKDWRQLSVSEQLAVMEGFIRFNDLAASPEAKEIQRQFREHGVERPGLEGDIVPYSGGVS